MGVLLKSKIISSIWLILVLFYCCKDANEFNILDPYKENFNSFRSSVGLMPFEVRWQIKRFEERNAYWCEDSIKIKLVRDTTNSVEEAFYLGKALLFNDSDSLDKTLYQEVDMFAFKKRDDFGRMTIDQLFLMYDLKSNDRSRWTYSLEREIHDANENFFGKGSRVVEVDKLTRNECDSILRAWRLSHPSF